MKCNKCQKELLNIDFSFSRKLLGKNTEVFYCKSCIAKMENVSEETLDEYGKFWAEHGCALFDFYKDDYDLK